MRVYALSDIHVDQEANRTWVHALSRSDYVDDVLLLAGDVTHRSDLFARSMEYLRGCFREVFFVPGNHDLWVTKEDRCDSLEKFHRLIGMCRSLDVQTSWRRLGSGRNSVAIVPLLSWYARNGESDDTLYAYREGASSDLSVWTDTHLIRWPSRAPNAMCDYFLDLNQRRLPSDLEGQVITFSHFLPRQELMARAAHEPATTGNAARFNFSAVAGNRRIDRQLRELTATIHVYGHQHRNRVRTIEGVKYASCCLGYERERKDGLVNFQNGAPLQVWSSESP